MELPVCIGTFEFDEYDREDDNSLHGSEQLRQFLRLNPELLYVDIIGVHTGYTNRVLRSARLKNMIDADVIFPEGISKRKMQPYVKDQEVFESVRYMCTEGICYFKTENSNDIFSRINHMNDSDYCGMLIPESLMSVKWYTHNGKKILLGEMDCESG
jgi:hypothetical protein